jgi:hypothetical protein
LEAAKQIPQLDTVMAVAETMMRKKSGNLRKLQINGN